MTQGPAIGPRQELLSRAPSDVLAELVDAVGDPQSLVNAALRLAMRVLDAERGLAFDTAGAMAVAGFSREQARTLRRNRLGRLLAERGVRCSSYSSFLALEEGRGLVVGMADVKSTPGGAFVLAVERDRELFTEQQMMAEVLRLLRPPFEQNARIRRRGRRLARKMTLTDLLLDRLEPLPQLRAVERLLIQEALSRTADNKSRAAAALGMTREGLRKKLIRLGLASGRRLVLQETETAIRVVGAGPSYAETQN